MHDALQRAHAHTLHHTHFDTRLAYNVEMHFSCCDASWNSENVPMQRSCGMEFYGCIVQLRATAAL